MKILLINKFHYLKGGSEKVYFATKDLLEKHGHQVVFFSMADKHNVPCDESEYFVENVDFRSSRNWLKKAFRYVYYPEAARRLEALIEKEKPDIAHLHNISHQLTPSILKPLRAHGIPIVQTLHDYQLICPNYHLYTHSKPCERCKNHKYYNAVLNNCIHCSRSKSALAALELYLQWVFGYYRKNVDLFISPSLFLKKKMEEWGVREKCVVLNNFLDLEKYEPDFNPGDYAICVSRMSTEKGIMTLLKAFHKLKDKKLVLVGDGPWRSEVEEYINRKQLKNVSYVGAKYDTELFDLIRRSRFSIVPSEWHENYPMIALESMSLGKPVLSSELGGLPEIVRNGATGWRFTAGDIKDLRRTIESAWNDNDLETFGRNGRAFVEKNNSAEKHYQSLMEIYESVFPKEKTTNLG
jgi:glycosyltransferase involved in cell wall biosynthesis